MDVFAHTSAITECVEWRDVAGAGDGTQSNDVLAPISAMA